MHSSATQRESYNQHPDVNGRTQIQWSKLHFTIELLKLQLHLSMQKIFNEEYYEKKLWRMLIIKFTKFK